MSIPYTYRVIHKPTGLCYYGVKYGKDADPKTFWRNYFTSSKDIHELIDKYGKETFITQIRRVFMTADEAIRWEKRILLRILNDDKYLNKNAGKAFSVESCLKGIATQREKHKNGDYDYLKDIKILAARKAYDTNKRNKTSMYFDKTIQSLAGKKGSSVLKKDGFFQSYKWRLASSRKDTYWITDGKNNKRISINDYSEFLQNNTEWKPGMTKDTVTPDCTESIFLWNPDGTGRKRFLKNNPEKFEAALNDGWFSKNGKYGNKPLDYKEINPLIEMAFVTNGDETKRIKLKNLGDFLDNNKTWYRGRTIKEKE